MYLSYLETYVERDVRRMVNLKDADLALAARWFCDPRGGQEGQRAGTRIVPWTGFTELAAEFDL